MSKGEQDLSDAARLLRWRDSLRAPIIAAPMFLASNPDLVVSQCLAGVIGSFPALNARTSSQLSEWLSEISERLRSHGTQIAPYGVNLILHKSNRRLDEDLALCVRYEVPLIISSMGASADVNATVRAYGGVTLHDVTTQSHARKAIEKGASGLIAVAAGAGGHAGRLSPFALVEETRAWFQGPLAIAGAIATGRGVAAARAMGADFAYVGSAFLAATEASVSIDQKHAMVEAQAEDIVYTATFSGTPANYLRSSIVRAGFDPDALPTTRRELEVSNQGRAIKTWSEIWGCGQGVGSVRGVQSAREVVDRMVAEYRDACAQLGARSA